MFWYCEKNLLFGHPWVMKWPKEISLCQIDMQCVAVHHTEYVCNLGFILEKFKLCSYWQKRFTCLLLLRKLLALEVHVITPHTVHLTIILGMCSSVFQDDESWLHCTLCRSGRQGVSTLNKALLRKVEWPSQTNTLFQSSQVGRNNKQHCKLIQIFIFQYN